MQVEDLKIATGILGLSSSLYIKSSDPRLLDKEPFWKTVYSWAKDKVVEYLQPAPEPTFVPIPARSR